MDLSPYVDRLADELALAAESGSEESRAVAARLTASLGSSVRLVLFEALSEAADEITRDLAPGSVEVRLRGREPGFVVTPPPTETDQGGPTGTVDTETVDLDSGATTRINLRLPDALKTRVDDAAAREHISTNAWLVRAAAAAAGATGSTHARPRGARGGQSLTGWVR